MMNPNQVPPGGEGTDLGSMSIMDNLRQSNPMTPLLICRQLLRFAASKSPTTSIDSGVEAILQMYRDGQVQDTLPKEILATFQSPEMESTLRPLTELQYGVIYMFLQKIFQIDKQGKSFLF